MKIQGKQLHYDIIDYLKGFSISTIVIMHLITIFLLFLPRSINKFVLLGGTGVHVFFFCSGFGLYISYKKHKLNYINFIKRRFIKIYIPYILVITISFCLPYMYDGSFTNRFHSLLSHLFLFKMFFPQFEESFGTQFWFISTLIQFYLTFPILCFIKSKLSQSQFFIICFLVSIIWWFITLSTGIYHQRIWGSFFLQYLWEFALGMIIADYLQVGHTIKTKTIHLLFYSILGLSIGCFLAIKGGPLRIFNDIFLLIGYMSLALTLFLVLPSFRKFFICISSFSYEWYLTHMLVFNTVFIVIASTLSLQVIQGLFALVISLFIAYIYHIFIQKII